MSFDPNGVGVANGNIFGFPVTEDEANIVIIPAPWDATASYSKGTSEGPKAILTASTQLDFFYPQLDKAYETKVFMAPISARGSSRLTKPMQTPNTNEYYPGVFDRKEISKFLIVRNHIC